MSEKIGKPITFASPIVDATLPDGSRINIVYGDDVSKRGSNFTIRKFSDKPLSLLTLIDSNTMDYTHGRLPLDHAPGGHERLRERRDRQR